MDYSEYQKLLHLLWLITENVSGTGNKSKAAAPVVMAAKSFLNGRTVERYLLVVGEENRLETHYKYFGEDDIEIVNSSITLTKKGGRPRALSWEEVQKLLRMHEEGKTNTEISETLKISIWTVRKYLKELSLVGLDGLYDKFSH